MSVYSKIQKNAERYRLDQMYSNMTPEQYREGIQLAVKSSTEKLAKEYEKELHRLEAEANRNIAEGMRMAIDTISVELLYELAKQMGCFGEDVEYFEEKKEKVQDIYSNTMKSIGKYANCKKESQARKSFEKRKKQVEKMFNIKF